MIINERDVKWYDVSDDVEDVEVNKTGRKSYLFKLSNDPVEKVNLWDMDKYSGEKEELDQKFKCYYANWTYYIHIDIIAMMSWHFLPIIH